MSSTILLSDNGVSSGSSGYKITAGTDGVLVLQTANSSGTATNAVYVDNKQNAGFGVTPSAWESGSKAIQMDLSNAGGTSGNSFNIWARGDSARMWVGAYFDGAAYYRQATGVVPTNLSMDSTGGIVMQSAPSGTAGTTFTNPNITAFFNLKKDNTLALQGGTQSAGTGIAFPAAQSASSDANTLDDYEEGTWTPTLTFGGASTGITYQTNGRQGTYVKIGKLVTATCYMYTSSTGSETGTMRVEGLPFAAASSSPYYMDYYFPYGARAGYALPSGAIPMAYLGAGGSQYEFYYTVVTTGAAPIQITKSLVSGSVIEISVQFSYTTA